MENVNLGIQGLFGVLGALKTGHSLVQGLSTVSKARDVAEPLMDILPEDWIKEEVTEVQGFPKVQFACLAMGVATTEQSTYMLAQASARMNALKKLARETKGINEAVNALQIELDAATTTCLRRFTRMGELLTDPGPLNMTTFLMFASRNQSELTNIATKIDDLLFKVNGKVVEVKHEQAAASKQMVGGSINIAMNIAFGAMAAITPGGAGMAVAGVVANIVGASVAGATIVVEIVNLVKCNEILEELQTMEAQLQIMKASSDNLGQRNKRLQRDYAELVGEENLF